jgi:hypothetical protein
MTEENAMGATVSRTARFLAVGIIGGALYAGGCAPHASALPAGFPDLNAFAATPVDNYIGTGPKGPKRFVSFSTPYNIECNFVATVEPVPAGQSQGISCDGDIPGYSSGPTATEACGVGTVADWGASGFRFEKELTNCPPRPANSGTLLQVGQKVTYENVTCAVGGGGLVACLDTNLGQHGFVLKPSGSVAF